MWWMWVGTARAGVNCLAPFNYVGFPSVGDAVESGCIHLFLPPGDHGQVDISDPAQTTIYIEGSTDGVASVDDVKIDLRNVDQVTVVTLAHVAVLPSGTALELRGDNAVRANVVLDSSSVKCAGNDDCVTVDAATLSMTDTEVGADPAATPGSMVSGVHAVVQLDAGTRIVGPASQAISLVAVEGGEIRVTGHPDAPVVLDGVAGSALVATLGTSVEVDQAQFLGSGAPLLWLDSAESLTVTHAQLCGDVAQLVRITGGCQACSIASSGFAGTGATTAISTEAAIEVRTSTFVGTGLAIQSSRASQLDHSVVFSGALFAGTGEHTASSTLADQAVDVPPGLLGVDEVALAPMPEDLRRQCAEFRYHPRIDPADGAWLQHLRLEGMYTENVLYGTDGPDGDGVEWRFDCDDSEAGVHALQEEARVDGVDEDCDGLVDCDDPDVPWIDDADGDGVPGAPDDDECGEGPYDCDDDDGSITEPLTYWRDGDGDGFGGEESVEVCAVEVEDLVLEEGDCDDTNPDVFPDQAEVPNDGIDQDCVNGDLVGLVQGGGCSCGGGNSVVSAGVVGFLVVGAGSRRYRTRSSTGSSGKAESGRAHRS